jgi:type VI protein secretion system component Hcp
MAVNISVTLQIPPTLQQIAKGDTATFEAQSFSWGADNSTSIGTASAGAGASKAKFAVASLTKIADAVASPVLFQLLVTAQHLETVKIEIRKAEAQGPGAPTAEALSTITLSTVFLTHFGQSISDSDGGLQEAINLEYGAAQMTINGTDATGKIITGTQASWSQITNTQNVEANVPA